MAGNVLFNVNLLLLGTATGYYSLFLNHYLRKEVMPIHRMLRAGSETSRDILPS